jgi:glutaredoxin
MRYPQKREYITVTQSRGGLGEKGNFSILHLTGIFVVYQRKFRKIRFSYIGIEPDPFMSASIEPNVRLSLYNSFTTKKLPKRTLRIISPFLNSIYGNLHARYTRWLFMVIEHVNGKKMGKVMLYALSTCGWCARTKELLRTLGVDFDYTFVDLLEGKEQDDAMKEVEKWNPKGSFPTLVIRDQMSIVGFREEEIREALRG